MSSTIEKARHAKRVMKRGTRKPSLTRKRIEGLEVMRVIAYSALWHDGVTKADRARLRTAEQWVNEIKAWSDRRAPAK